MALTYEVISRVMKRIYNPPVRGLTSKRARIRKKAERRLKGTIRGMMHEPNPLLLRLAREAGMGAISTETITIRSWGTID